MQAPQNDKPKPVIIGSGPLIGVTSAKLLAHIANGDDELWLDYDGREQDGDSYVATAKARNNDH